MTKRNEHIRGRVAQILNRRELVLNVGSQQGVTKGMKFAVLNARGTKIVDPDTGEDLGSVDVPKVVVEVSNVESHLAVAHTQSRPRNVGGAGLSVGGAFAELFKQPRWIHEAESLRLEDKPYVKEMDAEDSYVKIGDPVVQVLDEQ
jgi:hypothetical protein